MLLFSCGKKQQKVVVNLDELRPIPERDYEPDPDTVSIPAFEPKDFSASFRVIFEEIYLQNRFFPNENDVFPSRFGPKEFVALTQIDDYEAEVASWYFLRYSDSVMTDNAWLNWLDCFGAKCQSLNWGSADLINENSGQIWTNDTLIVACISKRKGSGLVKEAIKLDQFFGDEVRYALRWEQGKSGSWRMGRVDFD